MVVGKKGTDSSAATQGFEEALADLGDIGMTFGGGCFFGHRVFVSGGTARFIATGYALE